MIDTAKYSKIVEGITRKYKNTTRFSQDDLVNEGMRVVVKAFQNFDESKGIPLDAYIIGAVRREIYKYVVENLYDMTVSEWNHREEFKAANSHEHLNTMANARYRIGYRSNDMEENVTLSDILVVASGSHEEDLHKRQCVEILTEEMSKLPEQERQVIHSLFIEEKSYKEVAADLHISVTSIPFIRRKGLSLLSEKVKGRIVEL